MLDSCNASLTQNAYYETMHLKSNSREKIFSLVRISCHTLHAHTCISFFESRERGKIPLLMVLKNANFCFFAADFLNKVLCDRLY